jgi:PTS system nitrogen regulatory IIA component
MQVSDFLSPANVHADIRATDKRALLRILSSWAASACQLDRLLVTEAIERREELGSTGLGAGIAIPHARVEGLTRPFGLLARVADPIEFAAIDGKPVDIVFFLLQPAHADGTQLTALASAARKLRDARVAAEIRAAANSAELFRAIVS